LDDRDDRGRLRLDASFARGGPAAPGWLPEGPGVLPARLSSSSGLLPLETLGAVGPSADLRTIVGAKTSGSGVLMVMQEAEPNAEAIAAIHRRFLAAPQATMPEIVRWLDGVRRAAGAGWPRRCVEVRRGDLHQRLLEDPFTERAFRKPRGYAGDAVMLDHIYDHASILPEVERATPIGRGVRGFSVTDCLPSRAVRWRRELVARQLKGLVEQRGSIDVLAFPCGHLRELELLDERHRRHVRFVAADADPEALAEVARAYRGREAVACREMTVKQLLGRDGDSLGRFDFVYALGLLDYMPGRSVERVVQRLWTLVRPKGRFLTANFSIDTAITSYMEAFMDWWLAYRTTSQVRLWAAGLGAVARWETFEDPWRQVIYLACQRQP
jgi:extracellular factor (EF) 3-hydroxypalmitic acid methyl ester biosynthesis protein